MTLTINSDSGWITSDASAHGAISAGDDTDQWQVTWLPVRTLDRNAAITAMSIADTVARCGGQPAGQDAQLVTTWAAELGLTVQQAIHKVSRVV